MTSMIRLSGLIGILSVALFGVSAVGFSNSARAEIETPADWGAPGDLISLTTEDAADPLIVVNPTNNQQVVAVYFVDSDSGNSGFEQVRAAVSNDGGENWGQRTTLAQTAGSEFLYLQGEFGSNGVAHFTFIELDSSLESHVLYQRYDGSNFLGSATEVSSSGTINAIKSQAVASNGSEVSVFWAEETSTYKLNQSTNSGLSWLGVTSPATPSAGTVENLDMVADSSGDLHIVFRGTSNPPPTFAPFNSIFYMSENNGTLSSEVNVSSSSSLDGNLFSTSIARSGDRLMIGWTYRTSSTGGSGTTAEQSAHVQTCNLTGSCGSTSNWSAAKEVSSGNQNVNASSPFFIELDIATSGNRFFAFYHGVSVNRQNTQNEIIQGAAECSFGTVEIATEESAQSISPSVAPMTDTSGDEVILVAYEQATTSRVYVVRGTTPCVTYLSLVERS